MSAAALRRLPNRHVTVGAGPVEVRVRESSTAKTIRLRVGPKHPLEIIVPAGTSGERIDEVLVQRADWIARKLMASRAVSERARTLDLERPGMVWLDGKPIAIEFSRGGRSKASLVNGVVQVDGPPGCAGAALARWYRREARCRLRGIVDREAAHLRLEYASIAIRDQRTRWASCSPARNLAFNWRLVIAPEDVQRYVVIHELCHLRMSSHGKEFWRLLDHAMPGWRNSAAWLREHGHELHGYSTPT